MNVLFLMADELSWWALGHENPDVHTPNIDRLAARAMRFSAAYTPSPICVPTRAAIATGRDLHEIGYWSSAEPYDGRVRSWGHRVQDTGRTCVSIGKLHYRNQSDNTGFDQQIEPVHVLNGVGWVQALLRKPVVPDPTPDSLARDIGKGVTDYQRFDRRVADAACDWLSEPERREMPWCAFVSWLAPHFPLIAPEETFARYDPAKFESEAEDLPDHPVMQAIAAYFCHDTFFTPETRGIARAAYFALCSFLDEQVGRVLTALEEAGLSEDTLVLFTSDHGEMLGEKGFWTKSTMYESAVRVPLLMAGPGVEPGVWADPVSLIDVAPTICVALGVDGADLPGVDLQKPQRGRTILSLYHDGGAPVGITMARWSDPSGDWKLVHYAEGQAPQLFELRRDPEEMSDLASSEPDKLREGLERLTALMDPEEVNKRAFRDQAKRVAELGGVDAVMKLKTFDYTPADSR